MTKSVLQKHSYSQFEPTPALHRTESKGRTTDVPCDDHKVDHVAVHEAFVVPVCARQMVQEEPFMRKYCRRKGPAEDRRASVWTLVPNNSPLRFFFVPAPAGAAPSGMGIGPTSSSLSSSSCMADGGFMSTSSAILFPGPFRARLPKTDASCSESDMVGCIRALHTGR